MTTYLITGANRGIGRGLTAQLLQDPSTKTVVAAVRNPEHATSKALQELPKTAQAKLIVVKLDSTVETDAAEAVATLTTQHGIDALDVVIANAGIAGGTSVAKTSLEVAKEQFAVNALGPVALFQATAPLLRKSPTKNPRFTATTSIIGSLGSTELLAGAFPAVTSPYGASKAALNWFLHRLHFEEPWLTTFVYHPGLVLTEMSAGLAKDVGGDFDAAKAGAISVETSVEGILKLVQGATRETLGGSFKNYDGTPLPW